MSKQNIETLVVKEPEWHELHLSKEPAFATFLIQFAKTAANWPSEDKCKLERFTVTGASHVDVVHNTRLKTSVSIVNNCTNMDDKDIIDSHNRLASIQAMGGTKPILKTFIVQTTATYDNQRYTAQRYMGFHVFYGLFESSTVLERSVYDNIKDGMLHLLVAMADQQLMIGLSSKFEDSVLVDKRRNVYATNMGLGFHKLPELTDKEALWWILCFIVEELHLFEKRRAAKESDLHKAKHRLWPWLWAKVAQSKSSMDRIWQTLTTYYNSLNTHERRWVHGIHPPITQTILDFANENAEASVFVPRPPLWQLG
jgi:hypothetical protein